MRFFRRLLSRHRPPDPSRQCISAAPVEQTSLFHPLQQHFLRQRFCFPSTVFNNNVNSVYFNRCSSTDDRQMATHVPKCIGIGMSYSDILHGYNPDSYSSRRFMNLENERNDEVHHGMDENELDYNMPDNEVYYGTNDNGMHYGMNERSVCYGINGNAMHRGIEENELLYGIDMNQFCHEMDGNEMHHGNADNITYNELYTMDSERQYTMDSESEYSMDSEREYTVDSEREYTIDSERESQLEICRLFHTNEIHNGQNEIQHIHSDMSDIFDYQQVLELPPYSLPDDPPPSYEEATGRWYRGPVPPDVYNYDVDEYDGPDVLY